MDTPAGLLTSSELLAEETNREADAMAMQQNSVPTLLDDSTEDDTAPMPIDGKKRRRTDMSEWNEQGNELLLQLRFQIMQKKFEEEKQSPQEIDATWKQLAMFLSNSIKHVVDGAQCREQMEVLQKEWESYQNKTGDKDTPHPTHYALLAKYFEGHISGKDADDRRISSIGGLNAVAEAVKLRAVDGTIGDTVESLVAAPVEPVMPEAASSISVVPSSFAAGINESELEPSHKKRATSQANDQVVAAKSAVPTEIHRADEILAALEKQAVLTQRQILVNEEHSKTIQRLIEFVLSSRSIV